VDGALVGALVHYGLIFAHFFACHATNWASTTNILFVDNHASKRHED
jgi:hypothetical protein